MIGYVTIGSTDLTASAAFFDALFGALEGTRQFTFDTMLGYGFGPKRPMIMVLHPHDGAAPAPGNGTMIALRATNRATVDEVHALALSLGATDEGAPGPRGAQFYGGYFRDLDGNKFNVHKHG